MVFQHTYVSNSLGFSKSNSIETTYIPFKLRYITKWELVLLKMVKVVILWVAQLVLTVFFSELEIKQVRDTKSDWFHAKNEHI